ncbi:unnamed protein product, partial [Allacma fusca]
WNLGNHLKSHSEERPFQCDKCDYSAKTQKTLKNHQMLHLSAKNKRKLMKKCPFESCKFETIFRANLVTHLKIHSEERPFKCNKCDYSGKYPAVLRSHQIQHSSSKKGRTKLMRSCPIVSCQFQTNFFGSLNNHLKTHSVKWPYQCDKCEYTGKTQALLKTHQLTHLSREEKQKIFKKCSFDSCQYQTYFQSRLLRHLKSHSLEGPYKCDKCNHCTKEPEALKIHQYKHLENKRLQTYLKKCPIANCNYETPYTHDLISHVRSHQLNTVRKTGHRNAVGKSRKENNFDSSQIMYTCKICTYRNEKNQSVALHNENVHSLPFVVLGPLPPPISDFIVE